ncbi:hypothetical protein AwErysi_02640 [Erysipelotrichaceae bacterium]|nr:hypothetical protein AwErysi_02640 [Erysipelotrichaceae bacterium]
MSTNISPTPKSTKGNKGNRINLIIVITLLLFAGGYFVLYSAGGSNFNLNKQKEAKYSDFLVALQANRIEKVDIQQTTYNKVMLKYIEKDNTNLELIAEAPIAEQVTGLI